MTGRYHDDDRVNFILETSLDLAQLAAEKAKAHGGRAAALQALVHAAAASSRRLGLSWEEFEALAKMSWDWTPPPEEKGLP